MTDEEAGRVRTLEHRGEIYLSRADLFEEIRQVGRSMANPHDQAVAENLIAWMVKATRSEP